VTSRTQFEHTISNIKKSSSFGAKRHIGISRLKIAKCVGEEQRTETDCAESLLRTSGTIKTQREKHGLRPHCANAIPFHNRTWIWKTALTPLALRRLLFGRFLGFLGCLLGL
jgi:hypothetical protein